MEGDIDKVLPIVGKKSRSKINRKVAILVFFGVATILIGAFWLVLNSKKIDTTIGKLESATGQGSNEARMLETWGTVIKVSEVKTSIPLGGSDESPDTVGGAVLEVKSDEGKEYQVLVNRDTKISKNRAAGIDIAEKELAPNVSYKEIKSGDRIYLSSLVDLGREMSISADKVVNIKWFETVVPK